MSSIGDEELARIRERRLMELTRTATVEYPDGPVNVTDGDFVRFVERYPLVLVDFWAPWCGPCRAVAPVVERLAKDWSGQAVFGKLNTDENPVTSQRFGITAIPTLLVFRKGRMVEEIVGAVPAARIEAVLKKHL